MPTACRRSPFGWGWAGWPGSAHMPPTDHAGEKPFGSRGLGAADALGAPELLMLQNCQVCVRQEHRCCVLGRTVLQGTQ